MLMRFLKDILLLLYVCSVVDSCSSMSFRHMDSLYFITIIMVIDNTAMVVDIMAIIWKDMRCIHPHILRIIFSIFMYFLFMIQSGLF